MAEVAVVIGIAAAAVQFGNLATSILSHTSTLSSRFRSIPQCLQRTRDQLHLLLQLAELAKKKSSIQPPGENELGAIAGSSVGTGCSSQIWLDRLWKICAREARNLESIVETMVHETNDSRSQKLWKTVLTVRRESAILQSLDELEKHKNTLNIWLAQECLELVHSIRQQELREYGKQLATLANDMAILKSYLPSHSHSTSELRSQKPPQPMPEQQTYLTSNQSRTPTSTSNPEVRSMPSWPTPLCTCVLSQWNNMLLFMGMKLLLHHHKLITKCPMHSRNQCSFEISAQCRLPVKFSSSMIHIAILTKWAAVVPTVSFSLRTEARRRQLPLYSFFERLYSDRLWATMVDQDHNEPSQHGSRNLVSKDKQDYLFTVARKLVLHYYQSGLASPEDVDQYGRNLMHIQIELCSRVQEPFLARVVGLLLQLGIRTDTANDQFCTVQEALVEKFQSFSWDDEPSSFCYSINKGLVEWSPIKVPQYASARVILDCFRRWPESAKDWGCLRICDIIMRRSLKDLEQYIIDRVYEVEMASSLNTPLHFAAAAKWGEGVELLVNIGTEMQIQDAEGRTALDIALKIPCAQVIDVLVQGNYISCSISKDDSQKSNIMLTLLRYGLSASLVDQDMVVRTLKKNRFQLNTAGMYHELARSASTKRSFAAKLFTAGFCRIEEYNDEGLTPLAVACSQANSNMITFLLNHGANPYKCDKAGILEAGHFIFFEDTQSFWWSFQFTRRTRGWTLSQNERDLLKEAFENSSVNHSRCRCSPEGFTPATAQFRADEHEYVLFKRQAFRLHLNALSLSPAELRKQWHNFVHMEIFHRLELTHTCVRQFSVVRPFPEADRLEIEEEEEELALELERLMREYKELQHLHLDDTEKLVGIFLESLDQELRPRGAMYWWSSWDADHDLLWKGATTRDQWYDSSDKMIMKHVEATSESYVLDFLFKEP